MVNRGFTLLELMIALTIGLFIGLSMVGYYAETVRTSLIQNSENSIGTNAQSALSILSGAVREAGSGNPVLSEVPMYSGTCGNWTPCTADGGGTNSDRLAVFTIATRGADCANNAVSASTRLANVYYIDQLDGQSALYCRGFNTDTNNWVAEGEPLVQGVENIQFLYRYLDADQSQYISADRVQTMASTPEEAWERVRAVNISVLINDGEGLPVPDTLAQSLNLADAPPIQRDDSVLRYQYSTDALIMSKLGAIW